LAVLATYVDDELLAVYRYYRSLAVEVAFLTARDNLLMLFEKVGSVFSAKGRRVVGCLLVHPAKVPG
jgi:hypothetical protein